MLNPQMAIMYGPELVQFPHNINAVELAVGRNHQCILDDASDDTIVGYNNYGQLGLGNFTSYVHPVQSYSPIWSCSVSVQARSDFTAC